MVIQTLLSIFLLFALSRVVLQVRGAKISIGAFLFWSALFIFALTGVLDPNITTYVAHFLGIGRGTDVVLYISIALIFYLLFRLSISVEETKREITEVVRIIALEKESAFIKKRRYKRKR